jgi:hypothetical protein
MTNTHDWTRTRAHLVAGSTPAFSAFFAVHPLSTVRAIGYSWEWGQPQAAFHCVANTQAGLEQGMIDCNLYRPVKLTEHQARTEVRWNAGYFSHPAGLISPPDELSDAWAAEANRLHALVEAMRPQDYSNAAQYAAYEQNYTAFLESLVTACCEALAEMARSGVFKGVQNLDYWVGSTDEHGDAVRNCDARIRTMIG